MVLGAHVLFYVLGDVFSGFVVTIFYLLGYYGNIRDMPYYCSYIIEYFIIIPGPQYLSLSSLYQYLQTLYGLSDATSHCYR